DPSYKQLIPYVVFRHAIAPDRTQLFCYQRGKGQGEQRLHSKWSIGVGGHISAGDGEVMSEAYTEGMQRELQEEVVIDTPYSMRCVGLINDDETEVGQVHLGVVHVVDVERPAVSAREPDLRNAGFQDLNQLFLLRDQMESWSR